MQAPADSQVTIYCLHGFLGLPSDWDFLKAPSPDFKIEKVDLFEVHAPSPGSGLMDWASALNEKVATRNEKRILMGYSMGGRLALHALVRNPSLWDAAIIVSAHPGIAESDKEPRIAADEAWARKFETEPWQAVTAAWDRLPVFVGKPQTLPRNEANFRRADLAGALRSWSVGRQEDLKARLAALEMPILWVTGEEDRRYGEVARELQARLGSVAEFLQIPGAGHRVPWEQPEPFQAHFSRFLARVF